MQAWLWLSIAVISEVFATIALKESNGFTKLYPVFVVIIGYLIAFVALAKVLQILPVAVVYAIWSGLGIALVALAAWGFFGEKLGFAEIIGILLIISGIVVLKGFSSSLN